MTENEKYLLILQAAVDLAKSFDYRTLTRRTIAHHAGVSVSLVSHYLGSMDELRDELMRYAVKHEILIIIARGVLYDHPLALAAPDDIKRKAVSEYVTNRL